MRRTASAALLTTVAMALPIAATADTVTDTVRSNDVVSDERIDEQSDRITDRPVWDPQRCARPDRPADCCPVPDRDFVTDRCDHDVSLRELLWRAIHAHQWRLVVRILHALGLT